LGEINVGPALWKWNPHKMVGHTLISPNKRVSARESAQKRVLLAFLFKGKSLLALPLPSCWFNPVFTHNFFEIKLVLILYFKKET